MTTPDACPACRAPLAAGARFCHRCGRAVTGGGREERAPWIIAWSLVALSVAGIVYFVTARAGNAQAVPDMANVGSASRTESQGAPPDISQMTPRERFLRLNDRIMEAAGSGDTATVTRFSPMALAAYGMLDSFDPDVRFHAAAIQVRLGRYDAALALADTIAQSAPTHLFADMIRLEVAESRGDQPAAARARTAFLEHWPREQASGRPEYREHEDALEATRKRVEAS